MKTAIWRVVITSESYRFQHLLCRGQLPLSTSNREPEDTALRAECACLCEGPWGPAASHCRPLGCVLGRDPPTLPLSQERGAPAPRPLAISELMGWVAESCWWTGERDWERDASFRPWHLVSPVKEGIGRRHCGCLAREQVAAQVWGPLAGRGHRAEVLAHVSFSLSCWGRQGRRLSLPPGWPLQLSCILLPTFSTKREQA